LKLIYCFHQNRNDGTKQNAITVSADRGLQTCVHTTQVRCVTEAYRARYTLHRWGVLDRPTHLGTHYTGEVCDKGLQTWVHTTQVTCVTEAYTPQVHTTQLRCVTEAYRARYTLHRWGVWQRPAEPGTHYTGEVCDRGLHTTGTHYTGEVSDRGLQT